MAVRHRVKDPGQTTRLTQVHSPVVNRRRLVRTCGADRTRALPRRICGIGPAHDPGRPIGSGTAKEPGSPPLMAALSASSSTQSPAPPASTTPLAASTSSCWRVPSRASRAAKLLPCRPQAGQPAGQRRVPPPGLPRLRRSAPYLPPACAPRPSPARLPSPARARPPDRRKAMQARTCRRGRRAAGRG